MADLGRLVVNLEANIAEFNRNMNEASERTNQAMNKIGGAIDVAKVALGALGVALSVDALVGQANAAIDALADLDDMAQKTGASVENLSKLSQVAKMTGTEFGAVDTAIVKLTRNLADVDERGNKTAKALQAIGISTKDIKNQDPAQLFVDIAGKLQNYEDGAAKVALVTDLMGKSAADLIPFLNDTAENIDKFTGAAKEATAQATAYQDALGLTKAKYDEMVVSIVSAALPATNDFIGALSDVTNQSSGLVDLELAGWFDDAAVGVARLLDVAVLIPEIFKTITGSFKAVGADLKSFYIIQENANPTGAAKAILRGENPLENIKKAMDERNAVVEAANIQLDSLINKPANKYEQAVLGRIEARWYGPASMPEAGGDGKAKNKLNYGGGGDAAKGKAAGGNTGADSARIIASLDEETTTRMVWSSAVRDSEKALHDFANAQKYEMDQAAKAIAQTRSNVDQIRQDLMSPIAREIEAHEVRMEALQMGYDQEVLSITQFHAVMEAETQRHEDAKKQIRLQSDQQIVGLVSDSASQLYKVMKDAGIEQTALGRALFAANKALAVAEIIMNTEVAATAALKVPVIGMPLSFAIRAMGYASAGVVIGTTIASAEGGYDIPAGTNPVTQLHEKEMVLPKAQADVIRGLAARGGASGGGDINQTITIHIDGTTDMERNQKLVYAAVQQGNAELVDRLQRAGRI